MTTIVGIICLIALIAGVVIGWLANRGKAFIGETSSVTDPANDPFGQVAKQENFNPARCLFLFGPEKNDPDCTEQRRLIKPLLQDLLAMGIGIVEIYGDRPPTRNGKSVDWIDTQLLRQTMNAEQGFHFVFVNARGRASLHSIECLSAQALVVLLNIAPKTATASPNKDALPTTKAVESKPVFLAPVTVPIESEPNDHIDANSDEDLEVMPPPDWQEEGWEPWSEDSDTDADMADEADHEEEEEFSDDIAALEAEPSLETQSDAADDTEETDIEETDIDGRKAPDAIAEAVKRRIVER